MLAEAVIARTTAERPTQAPPIQLVPAMIANAARDVLDRSPAQSQTLFEEREHRNPGPLTSP